jgi:4-oxalocrotonate tautomerase
MPTLTLKVAPPQSPERHQALALALTTITARTLGKRAEVTAVLIEDLAAAQWTIGARSLLAPTALLTIHITAGTNTSAHKAAFIEAAFAELQRQLAPGTALEEASYVAVQELPASDWGYGGLTQAARRLQRERATPAPPQAPISR